MSEEPESRTESPSGDVTEPEASESLTESEPDDSESVADPEPDTTEPVPESKPDGTANAQEMAADEVYCSSCGAVIKKEAEICPECGVRQQGTPQQRKNPGLAAVASFFFAGLGQIYNGQIGKGLILILVQAVNVALMFVLVGLLTYPIVWIYGIWDAYKTAEKINSGEITV